MALAEIPFSAEHLDYAEEEHLGRLLTGDDKATAWAWIWSYAQSLCREVDPEDEYYFSDGQITAEELIETGLSHAQSKSQWGGDYINKGAMLEGMSVDPTFWDKLTILKDIEIPQKQRNSFFSCSC